MHETISTLLVLVIVTGIVSQWVAWRLRLPAILLLSIVGVLLGPVSGVINPKETLGPLFQTFIGLAVAVILFEGSLNLRRFELKTVGTIVRRLITVGILVTAVLATGFGHFVAGLSWSVASVLGALLVVTGPTVIVPLLRQTRLRARTANTLKWEGIVNDPIGALLTVVVFEFVLFTEQGSPFVQVMVSLLTALVSAALLSLLSVFTIRYSFRNRLVPEYLKVPIVLAFVLAIYTAANNIQAEAGLLASTFFGIALGNTDIPVLKDLRRFKESVSIFLLSILFVLLTANLDPDTFKHLDIRMLLFLGGIVFVVRPLSVMLSAIGTDASWRERLFVGWIAPRGIVAAGVAGVLGPELVEQGYADGNLLVPYVFAVIFLTVFLHGLTAKPLSRILGLGAMPQHGLLIVGATPWSTQLASVLHDSGVPVLLVDSERHHLWTAKRLQVPNVCGQILSEAIEENIDFDQFDRLLAVTDDDAYNALVCTRFAEKMGWQNIFQLSPQEDSLANTHSFAIDARGQFAFGKEANFESFTRLYYQNWQFESVPGSQSVDADKRILAISKKGDLHVFVEGDEYEVKEDDKLIVFLEMTKTSFNG